MSRPRCAQCGRLNIGQQFTVADMEELRPHVIVLLKLAREFDIESDKEGTRPSAVEFVDWLALSVNGGRKYAKPAGNPNQLGSTRRRVA